MVCFTHTPIIHLNKYRHLLTAICNFKKPLTTLLNRMVLPNTKWPLHDSWLSSVTLLHCLLTYYETQSRWLLCSPERSWHWKRYWQDAGGQRVFNNQGVVSQRPSSWSLESVAGRSYRHRSIAFPIQPRSSEAKETSNGPFGTLL